MPCGVNFPAVYPIYQQAWRGISAFAGAAYRLGVMILGQFSRWLGQTFDCWRSPKLADLPPPPFTPPPPAGLPGQMPPGNPSQNYTSTAFNQKALDHELALSLQLESSFSSDFPPIPHPSNQFPKHMSPGSVVEGGIPSMTEEEQIRYVEQQSLKEHNPPGDPLIRKQNKELLDAQEMDQIQRISKQQIEEGVGKVNREYIDLHTQIEGLKGQLETASKKIDEGSNALKPFHRFMGQKKFCKTPRDITDREKRDKVTEELLGRDFSMTNEYEDTYETLQEQARSLEQKYSSISLQAKSIFGEHERNAIGAREGQHMIQIPKDTVALKTTYEKYQESLKSLQEAVEKRTEWIQLRTSILNPAASSSGESSSESK